MKSAHSCSSTSTVSSIPSGPAAGSGASGLRGAPARGTSGPPRPRARQLAHEPCRRLRSRLGDELGARRRSAHRRAKLPDVLGFAGDRPPAWVDDVFGDEENDWASSRGVSTLLIQTDHRVGLTSAHIDILPTLAL